MFFFLFLQIAYANPTLEFQAKIQNEALAEEAVTLLRCLAQRGEFTWEFVDEIKGTHWLKVQEESKIAHGLYTKNGETRSFRLEKGQAACDLLQPQISAQAETVLLPLEAPEATTSYRPWIWAGLGAAVLGGTIYFLTQKKSTHEALVLR